MDEREASNDARHPRKSVCCVVKNARRYLDAPPITAH